MNRQDRFERILASLHDASFDDRLWPAASALIDEACGSKGNCLVSGAGTSPERIDIFFVRFCYRGERRPDRERLYFEAYYHLDERIPRVRRLPDSEPVHVSTLYSDEEKETSLAYNEALPLGDTRDSVNVRLDGPDGSRIVWVAADPVGGDGWSHSQVEMVERLLPHIRQFVRVRQALVDARALSASLAALLENTRCGVIQLDLHGGIVAANDLARGFLRKGDGLLDQGGFLRALSSGDDVALQRVLARALPFPAGQGSSGSVMVSRPFASPRLAVHVSPVGQPQTDSRAVRVAALVLVVDPALRFEIAPELVSQMLGLTPAESQVGLLLAQGHSVRAIAACTGRRYSTIRWHLKHIFTKLNISRQTELVALVQSLAGLPKVPR